MVAGVDESESGVASRPRTSRSWSQKSCPTPKPCKITGVPVRNAGRGLRGIPSSLPSLYYKEVHFIRKNYGRVHLLTLSSTIWISSPATSGCFKKLKEHRKVVPDKSHNSQDTNTETLKRSRSPFLKSRLGNSDHSKQQILRSAFFANIGACQKYILISEYIRMR
jgi:hypothetical protein